MHYDYLIVFFSNSSCCPQNVLHSLFSLVAQSPAQDPTWCLAVTSLYLSWIWNNCSALSSMSFTFLNSTKQFLKNTIICMLLYYNNFCLSNGFSTIRFKVKIFDRSSTRAVSGDAWYRSVPSLVTFTSVLCVRWCRPVSPGILLSLSLRSHRWGQTFGLCKCPGLQSFFSSGFSIYWWFFSAIIIIIIIIIMWLPSRLLKCSSQLRLLLAVGGALPLASRQSPRCWCCCV